jgi:hypothetical protein
MSRKDRRSLKLNEISIVHIVTSDVMQRQTGKQIKEATGKEETIRKNCNAKYEPKSHMHPQKQRQQNGTSQKKKTLGSPVTHTVASRAQSKRRTLIEKNCHRIGTIKFGQIAQTRSEFPHEVPSRPDPSTCSHAATCIIHDIDQICTQFDNADVEQD